MWLLHLLPDSFLQWVVNVVLVAGFVATLVSFYLLKYIPLLGPYKTAARVASIVILLGGVYLKGGYSTEMAWRERVAELEAKIAVAEAKSKDANTKIVTRVVNKIQVVKTRGDDIVKYIDRVAVTDKEVIKFVESCPIPPAIIKAHNAAALNQPIEGTK